MKIGSRRLALGAAAVLTAMSAVAGASAWAGSVSPDRAASFVYAGYFGGNGFDPHQALTSGDALFMRPVYDRLVTFVDLPDGGVELGPQLATSYEFADDGLSITFELRDDVTFQDGEPFDAEAVRANMERAMGPDSTVAGDLSNVDDVEVIDPTHVALHLSEPDPSIPWAMAFGTVGMMVSPAAFETDLTTAPVGSGPFQLESFQKDAEAVYQRWDDHWDPDAALVDELTIATIFDAAVRFNGVRAGEYDAAYMGAPYDLQSRELESEGLHWVQSLSPISIAFLVNSELPPFDDVRVRQAVSMAINRQEISEQLLGGLNPPSYQPFNAGYLGHDAAFDVDPYDPDAARALVEAAGADGAPVSVIQPVSEPENSVAEVIQQELIEIGLDVELVTLAGTEARPRWREGGDNAFVAPLLAQAEPSLTLNLAYFGPDNPAGPPPELVEMADAGRALPVGSDEREQAYQDISAYLVENPIHIPVVQYSTVNLTTADVVGSERLSDIGRLDFRGVGIAQS